MRPGMRADTTLDITATDRIGHPLAAAHVPVFGGIGGSDKPSCLVYFEGKNSLALSILIELVEGCKCVIFAKLSSHFAVVNIDAVVCLGIG